MVQIQRTIEEFGRIRLGKPETVTEHKRTYYTKPELSKEVRKKIEKGKAKRLPTQEETLKKFKDRTKPEKKSEQKNLDKELLINTKLVEKYGELKSFDKSQQRLETKLKKSPVKNLLDNELKNIQKDESIVSDFDYKRKIYENISKLKKPEDKLYYIQYFQLISHKKLRGYFSDIYVSAHKELWKKYGDKTIDRIDKIYSKIPNYFSSEHFYESMEYQMNPGNIKEISKKVEKYDEYLTEKEKQELLKDIQAKYKHSLEIKEDTEKLEKLRKKIIELQKIKKNKDIWQEYDASYDYFTKAVSLSDRTTYQTNIITTKRQFPKTHVGQRLKDINFTKVKLKDEFIFTKYGDKYYAFDKIEKSIYPKDKVDQAFKLLDNPTIYYSDNNELLIKNKDFVVVVSPITSHESFKDSLHFTSQEFKEISKPSKAELLKQIPEEERYTSDKSLNKDKLLAKIMYESVGFKPKPKYIKGRQKDNDYMVKRLNEELEKEVKPLREKLKEIDSVLKEDDQRRLSIIVQYPRTKEQEIFAKEHKRLSSEITRIYSREHEFALQEKIEKEIKLKRHGIKTNRKINDIMTFHYDNISQIPKEFRKTKQEFRKTKQEFKPIKIRGVTKSQMREYNPDKAVDKYKAGEWWLNDIHGNHFPISFKTKKEAIERGKAHKELWQNYFKNPDRYGVKESEIEYDLFVYKIKKEDLG